MDDLGPLTGAIEAGDRTTAVRLTHDAVEAGLPPQTILDAMTAAMQAVGARIPAQRDLCPRDADRCPSDERGDDRS